MIVRSLLRSLSARPGAVMRSNNNAYRYSSPFVLSRRGLAAPLPKIPNVLGNENPLFGSLSSKMLGAVSGLFSKKKLEKEDVEMCLTQVRAALLEADVAVEVADKFIESVRDKASGARVDKELGSAAAVMGIVHNELVRLLGETVVPLSIAKQRPASVMMVGVQGSGKTTTSAKLALKLKKEGMKVMVVSLDTRRPAAQEQLAVLASQARILSLPIVAGQLPLDIAKRGIEFAKQNRFDVIVFDTAGRLRVETELMEELRQLYAFIHPCETLLVADSMMGNEAVASARDFNSTVACSGIILTRIDGDARGGAALSMRSATGVPIKLMGVGEKLEHIRPFNPKQIADRIIGKGEMISLATEVEEGMTDAEKDRFVANSSSDKFDLDDFVVYARQIHRVGGVAGMLSKLPGLSSSLPANAQSAVQELFSKKDIELHERIIGYLTPEEKQKPKLVKADRKIQIAQKSGTDVTTINSMFKKFETARQAMKRWKELQAKQKQA